jgi:hypothetical protein
MVNFSFGRRQVDKEASSTPPPTFPDSAAEMRRENVKDKAKNLISVMIEALNLMSIHPDDEAELKTLFNNDFNQFQTVDPPLTDDEIALGDNNRKSPLMVGKIELPEWGVSYEETWMGRFKLDAWPTVAHLVTEMTPYERAKIRKMEVPELLDFVRSEWPDREKVVFPDGYDGMMVHEMRERTINSLRLTIKELEDLLVVGKRRMKKGVVRYVKAVRPGLFYIDA